MYVDESIARDEESAEKEKERRRRKGRESHRNGLITKTGEYMS